MPCLEVVLPSTREDLRAALAAKLTSAFCDATGHPAEIFSVQFSEYGPGMCATGGRVWQGGDEVPYLHLKLYCGRLERRQKQRVVEQLSSAFTTTLGQPSWLPIVHITEYPYDDIGVRGQLLSDTYPELAQRPYYYSLG